MDYEKEWKRLKKRLEFCINFYNVDPSNKSKEEKLMYKTVVTISTVLLKHMNKKDDENG